MSSWNGHVGPAGDRANISRPDAQAGRTPARGRERGKLRSGCRSPEVCESLRGCDLRSGREISSAFPCTHLAGARGKASRSSEMSTEDILRPILNCDTSPHASEQRTDLSLARGLVSHVPSVRGSRRRSRLSRGDGGVGRLAEPVLPPEAAAVAPQASADAPPRRGSALAFRPQS